MNVFTITYFAVVIICFIYQLLASIILLYNLPSTCTGSMNTQLRNQLIITVLAVSVFVTFLLCQIYCRSSEKTSYIKYASVSVFIAGAILGISVLSTSIAIYGKLYDVKKKNKDCLPKNFYTMKQLMLWSIYTSLIVLFTSIAWLFFTRSDKYKRAMNQLDLETENYHASIAKEQSKSEQERKKQQQQLEAAKKRRHAAESDSSTKPFGRQSVDSSSNKWNMLQQPLGQGPSLFDHFKKSNEQRLPRKRSRNS